MKSDIKTFIVHGPRNPDGRPEVVPAAPTDEPRPDLAADVDAIVEDLERREHSPDVVVVQVIRD